MQSPQRVSDLVRTLCVLLLIGALLVGCFKVLRPFLPGLMWGGMIVVASWPLMLRLQAWLGGRRGLATACMIIVLSVVVMLPLALSIATLVNNGGELVDWVSSLRGGSLAKPPEVVSGLPYVGTRAASEWQRIFGSGADSLSAGINSHGREITSWIFSQVGSIGSILLHFTITILVAAILFMKGEAAARFVRRMALRLSGQGADDLVTLAAKSISAVAMGIVVTAMVQSVIGGAGLMITGVPFAAVLTSLMLMLCLAQVGPAPILVPAVIWMFWHGDTWQGVVLLVFAVVCLTLDNVMRPLLIKRGADIPLILCFLGSVGGLMGFGLIGLFVGPVILTLARTLLIAWVAEDAAATPSAVD